MSLFKKIYMKHILLTFLISITSLFGISQDTLYSSVIADTILPNTVDSIIVSSDDSLYATIKYKASSNGVLDNRLVVVQYDTVTPPSDALVAYYPFNSQNTNDSLSNYNATPIGAVNYNDALTDFDNYYVDNNTDTKGIAYPSIAYGNEFTISCLTLPRAASATPEVIFTTLQPNDGFEIGWIEGISPSTNPDSLYIITGNGSLVDTLYSDSDNWTANAVHFVCVTINRTAGTAIFYMDGVEVGNGSIRTDFENTSIARSLVDFSDVKNTLRRIDNVVIYNKILTPTEVSSSNTNKGRPIDF